MASSADKLTPLQRETLHAFFRHERGFQRYVMTRGEEGLVVDLVWDRAHQIRPEKPEQDGIRVDPPEEILANKLTTLLSRAEERDLVDVFLLERAGFLVDEGLAAAPA